MKNKPTTTQIYREACPNCRATSGHPCTEIIKNEVRELTITRFTPHHERIEAAKKTLKAGS